MLNITDDYDSFTNYTDNGNDDINIILKYLLLSNPGSVLFLSHRFDNIYNSKTFKQYYINGEVSIPNSSG